LDDVVGQRIGGEVEGGDGFFSGAMEGSRIDESTSVLSVIGADVGVPEEEVVGLGVFAEAMEFAFVSVAEGDSFSGEVDEDGPGATFEADGGEESVQGIGGQVGVAPDEVCLSADEVLEDVLSADVAAMEQDGRTGVV
jgi:hypothetical protein